MQGRFHYYEGYPMSNLVFPVRVLKALGAAVYVVTNAAGGLNPFFQVGQVMLIVDHINLQGTNALIGPNDEAIGPRFPDMTNAYDPALLDLAREVAAGQELDLQEGVYVAVPGPSFETKAERRMLRVLGADAVGMSTVPEVTAANHCGLRVLGFSAITNKATGEIDQVPDAHEDVLAAAAMAGEKMVKLVKGVIGRM
jgi:purine-nucleoside phosphorylase